MPPRLHVLHTMYCICLSLVTSRNDCQCVSNYSITEAVWSGHWGQNVTSKSVETTSFLPLPRLSHQRHVKCASCLDQYESQSGTRTLWQVCTAFPILFKKKKKPKCLRGGYITDILRKCSCWGVFPGTNEQEGFGSWRSQRGRGLYLSQLRKQSVLWLGAVFVYTPVRHVCLRVMCQLVPALSSGLYCCRRLLWPGRYFGLSSVSGPRVR